MSEPTSPTTQQLPTINPSPVSPSPSDRDKFAPRAYGYLSWIYKVLVPGLNAFVAAFNADVGILNTYAETATIAADSATASASAAQASGTTATTKAGEAQTAATQAAAAKIVAEAARDAAAASAAIADGVPRTTGTAKGDLIAYSASGVPARLSIGTEGQVPCVSSAAASGIAWVNAPFVYTSSEVSVTGAVTLTTAAFGKMHVCTGTSTDYAVGLPAATGNAGKLLGIRIGLVCTKLVTLDANAAELIDGATTRVMWAGESAILLCDGSGWTKIAGKSIPMQCQLSATASQTIASGAFATMRMDQVVFDIGSISVLSGNKMVVRREGIYTLNAFIEISTYINFNTIISISTWRSSLSAGGSFSGTSGMAKLAKGLDVFAILSQSTGSNVTTAGQYANILVSEVVGW